MPRVVEDQRNVYETNELFRRLSRESEIKYIGYRDKGPDERRALFHNCCTNTGKAEIAFVTSGTNLTLQFFPWNADGTVIQGRSPPKEYVNFDHEPDKVYLMAPFILNGVCVCWKGWVNLLCLSGMGYLEFDEERARIEAAKQVGHSQLTKMLSPKSVNNKHPAAGSNVDQLEKRPRMN